MSSRIRVSVVIPTRNRSKLLHRLLESLGAQTVDSSDMEVIVVDDGSSDDTRELVEAKSHTSKLAIRLLCNPEKGTGSARNHGASHALGDIVAFMDDDVTLRADCIERALAHFDSIGAPGRKGGGEGGGLAVVESTLLTEGSDKPFLRRSAAQGFITNAIFYRKSVFVKAGGFDSDFFDRESGVFFRDDLDLGLRVLEMGYGASQPDDVVAWHPNVFTNLRESFRHARRYVMDPLLYRKHPTLFRRHLERKRLGPFTIARPLHYLCLLHCVAMIATVLLLMKSWVLALLAAMVAGVTWLLIRLRYQGAAAFRIWNVQDSLGYAILPWWYMYWYVRGCIKHGGWSSIV